MPSITITITDVDRAIDFYAACAHQYGLDNVTILNDDIDDDDVGNIDDDIEAVSGISDFLRGRTPALDPVNTTANTTTTFVVAKPPRRRAKRPLIVTVPCPYCHAVTGERCMTSNGNHYTGYDYGHRDRRIAADKADRDV